MSGLRLSWPRQLRNPFGFWRRLSLRTRLTLTATIAVAAGIGGGVGYAYFAVSHELIDQFDAGMQRQFIARGARPYFLPPHSVGAHLPLRNGDAGDTVSYVQFIDSAGKVLNSNSAISVYLNASLPITTSDKLVAAGGPVIFRSEVVRGVDSRIMTAPLGDGQAIQIAKPLTDVDEQLSALGWELFGAAAAGIVLSGLGGWLVTRTTLRPVAELTGAAERIAATHDLAHRIPDTGNHGGKDELGRLAASFNSMLDAVQEATDRQRQLVADASHELRTPLTSLRTNVEVLARADRLDPEDREQLVSGIMSGIDDLTALVSDTVELARGEEKAGQFEDLRWDLLVDRCVQRARVHWPAVRFEVRSEPSVVTGVSDRLAKAVRNLLDNAAKFSKFSAAESVVEVDIRGEADSAVLTVRDHGPGIPAEDLPHVFDRFYRAASARDLPGSGLGLAIVAQVAAGHGGEITAGHAVGGGAVFRLALPRRPLNGLDRHDGETLG